MSVKVGLQYIDKWNESLEAQVVRYEQETVEKGQIVFYGPSNFTRWSTKYGITPMREVLLGKSGAPCVINRGFGSSCSEHQLYYYPRMVRPLEPKVLVYSPFGNYGAFGYSIEEAWELAQRVIMYALTDFPGIRIYLCGTQWYTKNPEQAAAKAQRSKELLQEFVKNTPNCYFVNVYDQEQFHREEYFVEDGVHFNAEGYSVYGEFFKEVLKEELACF